MFRHPENEYDWQSSDAAVDEVLLINECKRQRSTVLTLIYW